MNINDTNMSVFLEEISDTLEKSTIKKKNFKEINSISLNKNECIYIVDFNKNELVFNKGFHHILGYNDDEITIEFIESLYHPDDIELVNTIIKKSIVYSLAHPENSMDNMLFISYRLRKKNGSYLKILSQASVYDFDENTGMSSTLIRITDISFIDNTENVNWDFKAPHLNKKVFTKQIYKTYANFFTAREVEVILEIKKGLTNQQISESLNISIHTVATHRKHIFKKTVCRNTEQLLLFCEGKGII